jgi:hypothetical protein
MNNKNDNIAPQLKGLDDEYEITEKDFYPPEDTRLYNSYIEDIYDGDNFDDYIKWFYECYGDEIFDT